MLKIARTFLFIKCFLFFYSLINAAMTSSLRRKNNNMSSLSRYAPSSFGLANAPEHTYHGERVKGGRGQPSQEAAHQAA